MFYKPADIKYGSKLLSTAPPELTSPPEERRGSVALDKGLYLSDKVFCKPTLIIGDVGQGKSQFLMDISKQLSAQLSDRDTMVIFASKRELLSLKEDGDIVIEHNTDNPECIWNIFEELQDGRNEEPEVILREILETLFSQARKHSKDPFFVDAAEDLFLNLLLSMWEDPEYFDLKRDELNNKSLLECIIRLGQVYDPPKEGDEPSKEGKFPVLGWELAVRGCPRLQQCASYIGDTRNPTPLTLSVLSQLRAIIRKSLVGVFSKAGTLSCRKLLDHRRVFFLYDYASSGASSMPVITALLNRLTKLCVSSERENKNQRSYFILDELAMLDRLQLVLPTSFGRSAGFRLFAAIQTPELLQRVHTKAEADMLLSLFSNICCFYTSSRQARDLMASRSGEQYLMLREQNGRQLEGIRKPVVADVDFLAIKAPGDAICMFAGHEPFIYRGHTPGKV